MTLSRGPLDGVLVIERAGRLAVAACAHLLAALGARVVRVETAADARCAAEASAARKRLMRGGKEIVSLPVSSTEAVRAVHEWLAAAEVVVLEPAGGEDALSGAWRSAADEAAGRVVCTISPAGLGQTDLLPDASDALVQAACGLMAVTGASEDEPEHVRVPVAELTGAVVGLTSVLAALRVRRRDGAGQLVDLSLVEAMADQLRTQVGLVGAGQTRGFRIGCRHALCSPWNVYRARDGWVMICSASDANWRGILERIGRPDLEHDERYSRAPERARHADEVDALVQTWTAAHTIEDVVAKLAEIDVPAGPALDPRQVPEDALLNDCGTVQEAQGASAPRLAFALSRSRAALMPEVKPSEPAPAAPPRARASATPGLPLAGVRVVELTRYAAGPLAGYLLASLGAEVIKIEPPGGEETRTWKPRFGNVSGYFANFNAGKRFVGLDLKAPAERERLRELIATADVLLHNMRPGAMESLGLGAERLSSSFTRLVYCAISGFGLRGPKIAAFDTVIQARLGLTALAGDGRTPLRVGYSIADQLAGHYAAAGVLAALVDRDATGAGQVVDVPMADAIAWLTHLAWSADEPQGRAHRVRAADGWVMTEGDGEAMGVELQALGRDALVRELKARGVPAAAVLEVDEVLAQPALRARRSVYEALSAGVPAPVIAAPFGLTATPVLRAQAIGEAGQDNDQIDRSISEIT